MGGRGLDQVGSNFFPDEDNEGTIIYVIWFFLSWGGDNNPYVLKKCTIFDARGAAVGDHKSFNFINKINVIFCADDISFQIEIL